MDTKNTPGLESLMLNVEKLDIPRKTSTTESNVLPVVLGTSTVICWVSLCMIDRYRSVEVPWIADS